MSDIGTHAHMILHPGTIAPFDRGTGVRTIPLVGKWNTPETASAITTGITVFAPGTALPLHLHNVEETVMVLQGEATAVIGEERFDLDVGDTTWLPQGVPHCFLNRGQGEMRIYWVYGGRAVTRTMCATGETIEHLSDRDRGALRS